MSEPSRLIQSADGETIIAVDTEASVPRATMLDEAHPDAAIYGSLASAFPGQSVYFSSATSGGRQIVVSVVSDRNSSELYLYDRSTGKARFLMQGRNWLDPATMARVKPFSSKNRDGMTLYGYLTIPHGSDGKNLPLIVSPHGGPMGPRDAGRSTGKPSCSPAGAAWSCGSTTGAGSFGKAFEDMAYGQWAQGVMNDVIDATKWTSAQGHADPDRVCTYDGSFGGYAALMAQGWQLQCPAADEAQRLQQERVGYALPATRLQQHQGRAGRHVAAEARRRHQAPGLPVLRRPRPAMLAFFNRHIGRRPTA